ncbi:MAG: VWA domain-containing protein [Phycisphaerales bacterium]|nr:VWA domain-containing protein [Phycisphaerales bacterium]
MSDFHFVHPLLANLTWIILILGVIAIWTVRRRSILLKRFADNRLLQHIAPGSSVIRPIVKACLVLAGLTALMFASMDPRWGVRREEIQRRGMDVFFVLDVSRSMLAEDATPNRLERAKQAVSDTVERLGGDRAGLISFAGDAQVESPLTLNYRALGLALDDVSARSSARGGSMLGEAIRVAAGSFTDEEAGGKAIVVLSDGEDQESAPVEAARKAYEEQGIRIYTVGLGDDSDGARIPVFENGQRTWLRHDGEQVWSRMEPSILEATARAGEGAFIAAGTKQFDLGDIFETVVAEDQRAEMESTEVRIATPRFQWFAGLAFLFLMVDCLVPNRRRTPGTTTEQGGAS